VYYEQGRKHDDVVEEQKLETLLESKVVAPVEQTLLGLQRDTVYWQRGLLASPSVGLSRTCLEPYRKLQHVDVVASSS
jgi:hypothetical protein